MNRPTPARARRNPVLAPAAPAPDTASAAASGPADDEPLSSDTLLRGRQAVSIRHNGTVYRLQATRLGKLILTK